mmetsp:Transcript_2658/g.6223  ORF Transcript_2658/g.6223 Transcript_2658/m.6223 type:complete len:335 (-) Transcript_2658:1076-2080(-)
MAWDGNASGTPLPMLHVSRWPRRRPRMCLGVLRIPGVGQIGRHVRHRNQFPDDVVEVDSFGCYPHCLRVPVTLFRELGRIVGYAVGDLPVADVHFIMVAPLFRPDEHAPGRANCGDDHVRAEKPNSASHNWRGHYFESCPVHLSRVGAFPHQNDPLDVFRKFLLELHQLRFLNPQRLQPPGELFFEVGLQLLRFFPEHTGVHHGGFRGDLVELFPALLDQRTAGVADLDLHEGLAKIYCHCDGVLAEGLGKVNHRLCEAIRRQRHSQGGRWNGEIIGAEQRFCEIVQQDEKVAVNHCNFAVVARLCHCDARVAKRMAVDPIEGGVQPRFQGFLI